MFEKTAVSTNAVHKRTSALEKKEHPAAAYPPAVEPNPAPLQSGQEGEQVRKLYWKRKIQQMQNIKYLL